MGLLSANRPAGISELISASESTICQESLSPRQEYAFSVNLRTPTRPGTYVSYWRLATKDGFKFGDRLWCEVVVEPPQPIEVAKPTEEEPTSALPVQAEQVKEETPAEPQDMIFPKLEKESPESSVHQDEEIKEADKEVDALAEDFEDCGIEDDWEGSDAGFLTDEEYDILDASDEEYLENEQKKLRKH